MTAKKPAKKAPAKRKPAAKKRPVPAVEHTIEHSELSPECKKLMLDLLNQEPPEKTVPSNPIAWRSWLVGGAKIAALLGLGFAGGVWQAGGIPIGPGPQKADVISAVFDEQESALRELSGERAKALRAGTIKSEAESVAWMQSRFLPRVEASWVKLLTAEAAAFGGEQWTAEKEAAWIEGYVR
jgi:hypothetical protein